MDDAEVTIGELFTQTWELMRETMQSVIVALLILVAMGVVSDLGAKSGRGGFTAFSIATIVAQYVLTAKALNAIGLLEGGKPKRRIMALVGLELLVQCATLLGLLLIVPGVLFFVRWSIAVPILLSEDVGVIGAMRRSWEETRDRFWTILVFFLTIYVPLLGFAIGADISFSEQFTVPSNIITNLLIFVASAIGWYGSVAIYASRRSGLQLQEVFA